MKFTVGLAPTSILYLIFALEHPFVGALSVKPDPYVNVLQIWREDQPTP